MIFYNKVIEIVKRKHNSDANIKLFIHRQTNMAHPITKFISILKQNWF